jgi:hypothetical protein
MKKYVISLIAVLIGMAFLASCQQSGTTGTGTAASAMAKPSPTPSKTRHYKTTGGAARRNPPKTEGSAETPSPAPGGFTAPAPTP